jgi:hypothetical protein
MDTILAEGSDILGDFPPSVGVIYLTQQEQ